ncbi:MAG TPA: hypothetical protein VNC22_15625 [Sporichthya sp.]|jgi:hypothetical protein|nr:hypothetical protein [Sporichthya sp.]
MPERPHALVCLPSPTGYLLIDPGDDPVVAAARDLLWQGKLPDPWPASLEGVRLALEGDLAGAIACYPGSDLLDRVNRFVLAPTPEDLPGLRADVPSALRGLIDALAFEVGLADSPPPLDGATADVAALVLAAQASHAVDAGNANQAVGLLHDAAAHAAPMSPAAEAILLGTAGMVAAAHPVAGVDPALDLQRAVDLLARADLTVSRAELHFQLGSVLHERAAAVDLPPQDAIHHYHCTLQLIDRVTAPELWAAVHLNLGTAYLVMPMVQATDQLRVGIATQSLRSALEVFTAESHPQQWASTQINLANALVYMPSTHRADNLVEAVGLYEQVVDHRDAAVDPVGRARLLSNLGNALAHLGVFDDAKARLMEARYLFEVENDLDGVMTVRSILDEISRESVPATVAP